MMKAFCSRTFRKLNDEPTKEMLRYGTWSVKWVLSFSCSELRNRIFSSPVEWFFKVTRCTGGKYQLSAVILKNKISILRNKNTLQKGRLGHFSWINGNK
jgi:hypothetical protein